MRKLLLIICGLMLSGQLSASLGSTPDQGTTNDSALVLVQGFSSIEETELEQRLRLAASLLEDGKYELAEKVYVAMLRRSVLTEAERKKIMLDLAQALRKGHFYGKAQQVYTEWVRKFPNDGRVPEVLMEQGYVFREMGLQSMALAKFYAVISSCLNLRGEDVSKYQEMVARAQTEIAETYYLEQKFEEAAQFFERMLKLSGPGVNRAHTLYRLIKSYSALEQWDRVVVNCRAFLAAAPESPEVAEVRYALAESLKQMGRNNEALQEVLVLLQGQEKVARLDPAGWRYWQKRTGKVIAAQLSKERDYDSALKIYLEMIQLDQEPEWQLPILYQAALVYESLRQPVAAVEIYESIISRGEKQESPSTEHPFADVVRMAKWRKDFILWEAKAAKETEKLFPPAENDLISEVSRKQKYANAAN